jgi:hypothetical protein
MNTQTGNDDDDMPAEIDFSSGKRGQFYKTAAKLKAREECQAAARRLGDGMAKLDALNLPPLTQDEVEKAVQESIRERRREAGD